MPLTHTFERIAVYELYFSYKKMQIFESNNKNTISTTTSNYGEPFWIFMYQFFLKSIHLKVPNLTAPLKLKYIHA